MDQKCGLGERLLPKQPVINFPTRCELQIMNHRQRVGGMNEISGPCNGNSKDIVIKLLYSVFVFVSCNDIV